MNRMCRRCLLQDMPDEAALLQSVRELIDLLEPRARAPQEAVRRRLQACAACAHLNAGTCALCGCYVELRAAKARMSCPDMPPRWTPTDA